VGEVLSDLRRVDAGELGELLGGDGSDRLIGDLEQRPVVEGKAGDGRLGDQPGLRISDSSRLGTAPCAVPARRPGWITLPRACARSHKRRRGVGGAAGITLRGEMVTGLAFLATAIASMFAESTLARATQRRRRELWDWTVALAMFALAAAALALGTSNGWDRGTYRVFFLLGAVLTVPWLALGTVDLLFGPAVAGGSSGSSCSSFGDPPRASC